MDKMSEENRTYAIYLMDTTVTLWGVKSSPLAFAYENDMLDIVAHPISQKSVRKQWYNNLAADFISFLKVTLVLINKFKRKYLYKFNIFIIIFS